MIDVDPSGITEPLIRHEGNQFVGNPIVRLDLQKTAVPGEQRLHPAQHVKLIPRDVNLGSDPLAAKIEHVVQSDRPHGGTDTGTHDPVSDRSCPRWRTGTSRSRCTRLPRWRKPQSARRHRLAADLPADYANCEDPARTRRSARRAAGDRPETVKPLVGPDVQEHVAAQIGEAPGQRLDLPAFAITEIDDLSVREVLGVEELRPRKRAPAALPPSAWLG